MAVLTCQLYSFIYYEKKDSKKESKKVCFDFFCLESVEAEEGKKLRVWEQYIEFVVLFDVLCY